jgi:hypothetical protein
MKEIAIEDLATVFVSEFIKDITYYNRTFKERRFKQNFIKMNYAKRRKLVEQTLNKMEKDYEKEKQD